jgi:hypothetical protein
MNQVGGCKLGGCWCVQKKKRRKRKAEKKFVHTWTSPGSSSVYRKELKTFCFSVFFSCHSLLLFPFWQWECRVNTQSFLLLFLFPCFIFFFSEDIVAFVVINLCKIAIARLCDVCVGVPAAVFRSGIGKADLDLRKVQQNCAISFWFHLHLLLHAFADILMWRKISFLHSKI